MAWMLGQTNDTKHLHQVFGHYTLFHHILSQSTQSTVPSDLTVWNVCY